MPGALVKTFFPFLSWLRDYTLADLKRDATAGCTVALVLVPQSMGNAQLAGLPAWHGLYAALLPALTAGLWGSSRQMVTGTVAVISLMAAAALQPLAISSPQGYIAAMALLTLMVGLLQMAFGLLRLGIVVNFLSLPVISGFVNAAAVIIALSQLPKALGIIIDPAARQYQETLQVIESALHYTHLPSLFMALGTFALIKVFARFIPRVPAVPAAVAVAILVSWLIGFERNAAADINDIASPQTQILLIQLRQLDDESKILGHALNALAARPATTKSAEMERNFRMQEQRQINERIRGQAALIREHLRRTLFVAERTPDGKRLYYLKKSPKFFGETTSQNGTVHTLPVVTTPGDEYLDSHTWRLRLHADPPDLGNMRLTAGGAVVGSIPPGLPHIVLPALSPTQWLQLLPQAVIIALVAFAESISIAKTAASRAGQRIDPNQELVGQGLANITGGLTLTCPVSGSFSNTALNINSKAVSSISCVFISLGAMVVLLFLTKQLYYLPEPVLAAVVMRAVSNMINFDEFRRIWTARRMDGIIALATFFSTLIFAPHLDYGIGIGVMLSLVAFFYRSMYPSIASLSAGPDNSLHDAGLHGLRKCRHIAVVHFQGPLFFANAALLEDHIIDRIEKRDELRHIHLVCTGITHLDSSGEESLSMVVKRAAKAGIGMSFSGVVGPVAQVMARTGILAAVGLQNIFITPREAVCTILKQIQHDEHCSDCPLNTIYCRERAAPTPGAVKPWELAHPDPSPTDAK